MVEVSMAHLMLQEFSVSNVILLSYNENADVLKYKFTNNIK